ncbi:MAG TPA: HAMP domain-containing sensor histidine kinase [Pyrinomonadaceae bacterium]|nr:HAMP domain-containing sensor histidine kinase [Pyrinomonadaceae bacterium]
MDFKRQKFLGGFNRYRLIITLGLAVLLPAGALIYVNFSQLRAFERDKALEATIKLDFQENLAIWEKHMNKKMYEKVDQARDRFPPLEVDAEDQEQVLSSILAKCSCFSHAFMVEGGDFVIQTQEPGDPYLRKEREQLTESLKWLTTKDEYKMMLESLGKKPHNTVFYQMETARADGPEYFLTAVFTLPSADGEHTALGGLAFDPCYLRSDLIPNMLDEFIKKKNIEQGGNNLAVIVYTADQMDMSDLKPFVSAGWDSGKPEMTRKFEDVFRGLAMGVKYQGTSLEAMSRVWIRNGFLILGFLSLMMILGIALTKHMVGKEIAVAKLKSDFVSNVSHELRTPLALIRLYAETLELGRITTKEKKHQYYRIIRKESERLTALINNILDFSRIEAGRKEYEFRDTDIADLVRNTLDSYRYQIEQQGFKLDESIDEDLPAVRIDREAIARALVNLVNNALKYSKDDKYLGVKLYRDNGAVKLEVADHGIGIARRDQVKIFEKFYRAGDPLVHNTKGSGLGLSLVRHITEAHGGAIEVESAPGAGSKFIMSLPLVAAASQQTRPAPTSVQQQAI